MDKRADKRTRYPSLHLLARFRAADSYRKGFHCGSNAQSRSHVGVQLPVHTAREPERRQYHLPRSGERAAARKCEVEQDVLALLNLCAGKGLVDGGLGAVNLNYTYS